MIAAQSLKSQLDRLPRVTNRNNRRVRALARVRLPENVTIDQIDRKQALVPLPSEIESQRQYVFSVGRTGRKVVHAFAFFDKDRLKQAVPDNGDINRVCIDLCDLALISYHWLEERN